MLRRSGSGDLVFHADEKITRSVCGPTASFVTKEP